MIEIKNLKFFFGKKKRVYDGVDLRLAKGHIHGLLGSNGVGKSTLLKLVAGLLQPTGGTIRIDGIDPSGRPAALLQRMTLLPEEFELPNFTAAQYARLHAPFYPTWSDELFRHACETLEVDPQVKFHAMSMGQRRKALIALTLACDTPILLLDEPTNGLDIPSKSALRRLLTKQASEERTIIISTHAVREVENLIDNVVILDQKGPILNASVAEIGRRLHFGRVDAAEALYAEERMGETIGVQAADNDDDGRIDLELLFTASIHNRHRLTDLFNTKKLDNNE